MVKQLLLKDNICTWVDDEDFASLSNFSWRIHNNGFNKIYVARYTGRSTDPIYLHRQVVGISDSDLVVCHLDQNILNNCKSNLVVLSRRAFSEINASKIDYLHVGVVQHRTEVTRAKSPYRGVYVDKSNGRMRWKAEIRYQSKRYRLGNFNSPEEAAIAYDNAAIKFYGELACTNFPKTKADALAVEI